MHLRKSLVVSLALCLLAVLLLPGRVAQADIDFNNDGLPDLLFQSQSTGQLVYWALDGPVYLGGNALPSPNSTDWQVRDTADLNADGHNDLIYQNATTGQVVVWYMNTANLVGGGALSLTPAPGYLLVGTGDFNGDNKSDLVFQNQTTGQVVVWYLNGLTVAGGTTLVGLPSPGDANNAVVGVGDFNGDGYPDLVFQNRTSHGISFVALRGVQVAGGAMLPITPLAGYNVAGLGDFNGDGKPDLLFQNAATGQLTYWLLDGTTYLSWGNPPTPASLDWHVAGKRTFAALPPQTYLINGISYVTTAKQETLSATFTQADGGVTLAGYKGYVRLHITGVGQAYGGNHNDAFYLYENQFTPFTHGWDGGYYQLAYSPATLPVNDVGQNAVGHLVGGLPAYSPVHDYTVLLDTTLSTAGQLHFGVSDAGFSDNTGAYTITVTQLTPTP
ncbi:MAG: hypothetical protein JWL77_4396 [Chthonomonadaceae bacterium]|nr:hypothetical protein [Chthonomonadaceae bacterium]